MCDLAIRQLIFYILSNQPIFYPILHVIMVNSHPKCNVLHLKHTIKNWQKTFNPTKNEYWCSIIKWCYPLPTWMKLLYVHIYTCVPKVCQIFYIYFSPIYFNENKTYFIFLKVFWSCFCKILKNIILIKVDSICIFDKH